MPSLKAIRTRIASVKSTQKITRAMKMVAGARLTRAQQRIVTMRPYAVKTKQVLASCTAQATDMQDAEHDADSMQTSTASHPLLVRRPERSVLLVVLTSDRGLCGAFNANVLRTVEREVNRREQDGQRVQLAIIGRKADDHFHRRHVDIFRTFESVWNDITLKQARMIARTVLRPFREEKVDAVYLVYNEFKSAMTQNVVVDPLLPLDMNSLQDEAAPSPHQAEEFVFEPSPKDVLDRLVPMYVEVTVLRALLESNAGEHGARMTAMDAATKNAKEMIDRLTLQYNRARQAAITKELLEIISGAEALKG